VSRTREIKRGGSSLRALMPEENPDADPEAQSVSGVRYASVLSGMHKIFPPQDLEQRNALSRSDGYWPYIQKGSDPPKQFTYGEFDVYFFAELLDTAYKIYFNKDDQKAQKDWQSKTFVDIGSGMGRLVLAAAALHPGWKTCRGVELLPGIHKAAQDNLESCRTTTGAQGDEASYTLDASNEETGQQESLALAPIQFTCGSFDDPYVYFGDADCVFVFSSCMSQGLMGSLSKSIGRQCKPGTIVITTEFMLTLEGRIEPVEEDLRVPSGSYKLELVEQIDGWVWLTGGTSTAFIHKVVESLWEDGVGALEPPTLSAEDMCYNAIKDLESGDYMANTESFLRGIYNNMSIHGLPVSWRPKLTNGGW